MKRGWTNGPWRFETETMTIRSIPGNNWVASMNSWDGQVIDQTLYNGLLIARAPSMADAINAIHDIIDKADENTNIGEALALILAITKIELEELEKRR